MSSAEYLRCLNAGPQSEVLQNDAISYFGTMWNGTSWTLASVGIPRSDKDKSAGLCGVTFQKDMRTRPSHLTPKSLHNTPSTM